MFSNPLPAKMTPLRRFCRLESLQWCYKSVSPRENLSYLISSKCLQVLFEMVYLPRKNTIEMVELRRTNTFTGKDFPNYFLILGGKMPFSKWPNYRTHFNSQ